MRNLNHKLFIQREYGYKNHIRGLIQQIKEMKKKNDSLFLTNVELKQKLGISINDDEKKKCKRLKNYYRKLEERGRLS